MQFELVHSERRRSIWWFEAQQGRRQLYLASAVTVMLGLLIGFIAGQLLGDGQIVEAPEAAQEVTAQLDQ